MRVKAPLPAYWPVISSGPPLVAEVLPGVTLTLGPLEALPANLPAWEDEIVFAKLSPENVTVGQVQSAQTATGWTVWLFGSDTLDPRSKTAVERRLHAVYRFDKHGGVATLRSADIQLFDAAVDEVIAVLLKAGPDWSTGEIDCLEDIWRGLDREPGQPTSAPERSSLPPPSMY